MLIKFILHLKRKVFFTGDVDKLDTGVVMKTDAYTVLLFAKNDAERVELVLKNFYGIAPVVILDGRSSDNTALIAAKYGAKLVQRPDFDHFGHIAKPFAEWALEQATTDYVFISYCSVFVPKELLTIFRDVAETKSHKAVRHGYYCVTYGRYVERSFEMRKSKVCHFFHKSSLDLKQSRIHNEWPVVAPESQTMLLPPNDRYSLHVFRDYDTSWTEIKHNMYETVEAKQRFESGECTSAFKMITKSLYEFITGYFFRKGFLGGMPGFMYHMWRAHMVFNIQARIWEYQNCLTRLEARSLQTKQRLKMLETLGVTCED